MPCDTINKIIKEKNHYYKENIYGEVLIVITRGRKIYG